jgi:hypothetical protein
MKKGQVLTVLAIGAFLFGAADARAQIAFGAEALFGSETDFGLGARVQTDLGTSIPLDFSGSFDLFFPDGPADYWEINGNVWYEIDVAGAAGVPYVGAGLNIGHVDPGGEGFSDTELAVNLGGGYRFDFANTSPFIEARFTIGGVDQFVIGGGVLLGWF